MKKLRKSTAIFEKSGLFHKEISREEKKRILGGGNFVGGDCTIGQASTAHKCDPCGIDKVTKEDCTVECISCD